ncbi:MAG: hypothetical protein HZA90_06225 [Verrucomicrobia bacterium]|nr:hypothetical protein [Verrucomicrobiota bacterium]
MKMIGLSLGLCVAAASFGAEEVKPAAKAAYENSFEKAETDKVPDDMMVLDGAWAVKAEGGNKFLELPGAPLDTFGVLFGPAEKENLAVAARAFGTSKGRRQPVFGVGLGGVGGYRLLVAPGKRAVELWKGDDIVASAPVTWESGGWTMLKLQLRKAKDGEWTVEGKAWKEGAAEPAAWQISHAEKVEPASGRASVWGSPLSGTPIRFDDLKVAAVK